MDDLGVPPFDGSPQMKFSWQTSKLRKNVHSRSCNQFNHSGSNCSWQAKTVDHRNRPGAWVRRGRVCVSAGASLDLQELPQKCARDCSESLIDFTSLHKIH